MSELINNIPKGKLRWHLLATVSLPVLLLVTQSAVAQTSDKPTVWIDLGGQLERISNESEAFAPPFLVAHPSFDFTNVQPSNTQRPPNYGQGAQLAVSIEPEHSNWVFSGAVRYGRSNGNRSDFSQTTMSKTPYPPFPQFQIPKAAHKFVRAENQFAGSHWIADFQAGKDVGLGILGSEATISLGVRFAQFSSKSGFNLHDRPDYGWQKVHPFYTRFYHNYGAHEEATRSFHGIGPSLSVKASSSLTRPSQDSDITLDWGVNAAVLFGRQKALVNHSTSAGIFRSWTGYSQLYEHSYTHSRSHSQTVPNLGGFAGVSFRYAEAKLSLGYRADFFFGAMDGGIDSHQSKDVGFYGPFATISFGLGR